MNRINTRSLVQGAMIAAIFGMLSIFNTYTGGMIDILICYFMVVPIAWYGYVYNIKQNILVMIVSVIVIFMFGNLFFGISSFSACCIGVFLGETLKRNAKKEVMLLGTLVICLINNILIYQVFSELLGMNLIEEMTVMYHDISSIYPAIQSTISLDMALGFIPLLLFLMSAMEMYVIILICQIVFMRLKINFPNNFHIASMHLSLKTGIFLAVCMLGSFALIHLAKIDHIILEYVYLLSKISFVIQGFSFVNFYAIIKKKRWIVIISFILFFIPLGIELYTILGILDIFSDLRGNLLYNRDIK